MTYDPWQILKNIEIRQKYCYHDIELYTTFHMSLFFFFYIFNIFMFSWPFFKPLMTLVWVMTSGWEQPPSDVRNNEVLTTERVTCIVRHWLIANVTIFQF